MAMGQSYQGEAPASAVQWNDDQFGATRINAFRVTKPYREPREGYAVALFATAREAKTAHPGVDPVFVREVLE
jgi:hypothetical protein